MDVGKPRRKYTIEPIRDPLKREQPVERPEPQKEPVRVVPERAATRTP